MLIILQKAALFLTLNLFISLIGQKFKHEPDLESLHQHNTYPTLSPPMSDPQSPLCSWFQSRINALYELKGRVDPDDPAFAETFNRVFAKNAVVYLNHEKKSPDAYLERLIAEHAAAIAETVEWKEMIEVPPEKRGTKGGIVAGFFVATRSLRFRIRVGPAQQLSYNSFSAKIEEAKVDPDPEDGSRLRITELYLTSMAKAAPLHFGPGRGQD